MNNILLLIFLPLQLFSQFSAKDISRYEQEAKQVTIIRDNWGIPHIYGKTDADAVFGLLYAQCEDDFKRVEMNYVEKLGRLAEVNGEKDLYNDLLIRMIIDSTEAINDYKNAPLWLHKLLDAFADGVNYYLYTHPYTKHFLLNSF
jgi:acyl-homoserine lactone acylase PvdQ